MPSSEPGWQESDCHWFLDRERGVGGFQRIGRHPNDGHGSIMLYVFSPTQRFLRIDEVPESDCIVGKEHHAVGGSVARVLGAQQMQFAWREPETEASLIFCESFYEPRNWMSAERLEVIAANTRMSASGHLECSGRIRGALRLGQEEFAIDALAHRDRSWGLRDMSKPWQHRMFSGTLGPALSFATFIMTLVDGSTHKAGFVVRDGNAEDISDLRILTTFEYDGFSVASGRAEIDLVNGDSLVIEATSVNGFVHKAMGDFVSTDHLSTFSWNGERGFLDLECSNNPTRGSYLPKSSELVAACVEQGLQSWRPR